MADRELIFVPLIGSAAVDDWRTVPHTKVWGFLDSEGQFECLHLEHGENPSASIYIPTKLFDAELAHKRILESNDTTVPDEVWQRVAVAALDPVRED